VIWKVRSLPYEHCYTSYHSESGAVLVLGRLVRQRSRLQDFRRRVYGLPSPGAGRVYDRQIRCRQTPQLLGLVGGGDRCFLGGAGADCRMEGATALRSGPCVVATWRFSCPGCCRCPALGGSLQSGWPGGSSVQGVWGGRVDSLPRHHNSPTEPVYSVVICRVEGVLFHPGGCGGHILGGGAQCSGRAMVRRVVRRGSGTGEVKQLLWEVSVVCSGERW
jgi:hypothetical protein